MEVAAKETSASNLLHAKSRPFKEAKTKDAASSPPYNPAYPPL